jgi:hypothetical protein
MTELSQILQNPDDEKLLPLVYEELRQLAAARMAQQASGQITKPNKF